MAQQTAVEWLINELAKTGILVTKDVNNLVAYKQAKQMEKAQIIKAHDDGDVWSGEKYYNETYKQQ